MESNLNYPKWLYHPKKNPVIVNSKEEQDELGSKWLEAPIEKAEKESSEEEQGSES